MEEALGIFKQSRSGSDFQSLDKKRQDAASTFIRGLDVSEPRTSAEKAAGLLTSEIKSVEQAKQLENPDARVALEESENIPLLEHYVYSYKGIMTGDDPKYKRAIWELSTLSDGFRSFQSSVETARLFGGAESVVWYEAMTNPLQPGVYLRAADAIGKSGVMVSQMSSLPAARYLGEPFDTNAGAIIPKEHGNFPAIWCFCSSPEYNEAVRQIDQSLKVTNATLVKVPFDFEYWTKVAIEKYPNGLPKPYSDDPTQWIFHGHPCGSVVWDEEKKRLEVASTLRTDSTVLQVAVARLLGYRWPAESRSGILPLESD